MEIGWKNWDKWKLGWKEWKGHPTGWVPPGAPLRGGSHLESKKQLASNEEV